MFLDNEQRDSGSSASAGQRRQATLRDLVTDAVREEPRRLPEVYAIVTALRPGTAKETIRDDWPLASGGASA